MNKEEFLKLADKISNGNPSVQEVAMFNAWYNSFTEEAMSNNTIEPFNEGEEMLLLSIHKVISTKQKKLRLGLRKLYFPVAASLLLMMATALWIFNKPANNNAVHTEIDLVKNEKIEPGSNKAILILPNGTKIFLDDSANGILLQETAITVTKTEDGRVVYSIPENAATNKLPEYHTIATPKGGQYQVNLPDGSRIWLNAETSIEYPTVFTGNERSVTISGEAYFEIAENRSMPFKVRSNGQVVEVLGTKFNVNSYHDEPVTATSLLEGSIKIKNTHTGNETLIKPNQKSVIMHATGQLIVRPANVERDLAWKNGLFVFESEDITSVMRKISRWYNVEIQYAGKISGEKYNGIISRFDEVSKILAMLEKTNTIKFKIEGRKITVE